MSPSSESLGAAHAERVLKRVWWRIVPFLLVCYFIAFVDRVNVGFAALTMSADIGLSHAAFGLGGSLFFVAYVLFEIPSNIAMQKVGARRWIARIMVSWGVVGIATAFVTGPYSFYASRFLLGAAEAGFLPGAILFLSQWVPKAYRARAVAWMMVAIPLSSFFGSPLSAAILAMDGTAGLAGWQWIFILESIPAVVAGIFALALLSDRPADAAWLTASDAQTLETMLGTERAGGHDDGGHARGILAALLDRRVLLLALIYSGSSATSNALSLWQPQILKSFGLSNVQTGLLNMIPFGIAAVTMLLWANRADRTGDRIRSTALPLLLTSVALLATLLTASLPVTLGLLTLVLICNYAIKGPFWALASETLLPGQAVVGIAAINSIAHLGTGAATWAVGALREGTGSFPVALLPLAALTATGAAATVVIGRRGASPPALASADA